MPDANIFTKNLNSVEGGMGQDGRAVRLISCNNNLSLYFFNFRSLSPGDAILRTSWGHIFTGYTNWVFVKTWDSVSRDAILQTSRRPYPQTFKKLGFYKTLSLCQETTSCRPVGVPILRLLKLGFWEKLESVSADANLRTSRGPYPKSFFQLWF